MSEELKPPDPPDVIAARYAAAAKKAVDSAAQVAIDAFDRVNNHPPGPKYKPDDAIASMMGLAGAALTGSVSLARVALQVQWDRRMLLVADNIASIAGTGLKNVLDVAEDAAKEMNKEGLKPRKQQQIWVDAAIKLASIGALRGAEIVETAVAGPGAYANPVIKRTFPIKAADRPAKQATLSLTELTLDGADVKAPVTFDPPSAKIAAKAKEFTIVFNSAGLKSGLYEGTVTAKEDESPRKVRKYPITILVPETTDPPAP